jgi:putative transposase
MAAGSGGYRAAVAAENSVLVAGVDVVPLRDTLSSMMSVLVSLFLMVRSSVRTRAALQLEVLALRHQLRVLDRSRPGRVRLTRVDRLLWVWLSRVWHDWRSALVIVKPDTVIGWHRRGFRLLWTWESRCRLGRPAVPLDIRVLIRTMSAANPLWGAPRIHSELLKLGIDVGQATVAKYMARHRRPPSQTWRTFLRNHIGQIAAADFFVVPTATWRLLFVLVILAHERRRIVHVAVTDHPTAAWTAQQLREAFPWDDGPSFLIRDRDTVFKGWTTTAAAMGIQETLTAVRSPWQNAYAERLIGSIRRECLDHVIVLNERGLRRLLHAYVGYYLRSRTHLSLNKDAPISRHVAPPADGRIVAIPQVGGLHHRYERHAA